MGKRQFDKPPHTETEAVEPRIELTQKRCGLPPAAVEWLAGRSVASLREDGNTLIIVSYPDYQKALFRA